MEKGDPVNTKQQEIEMFGQVFSEINHSIKKLDCYHQQRMVRAMNTLYAPPPLPYSFMVQEKK